MYLSIPSATYRDCLTTARTAMVTRGSLPVLAMLHFRITPEAPYVLEVTSTDLDVSLTQLIPLTEPGGPGAVCISLASLTAIKPDRGTPVRIDHAPLMKQFNSDTPDAQILYVKAGHSAAAHLEILPSEDFPHWTNPPGPEEFTCLIPGRTLQCIAESIAFQSTEETRPVLNGVLLSPDAGGTIVATNGRMLAKWQSKVTPEEVILPRKACNVLTKLGLSSATCAITREYDDHNTSISFRSSKSVLHTKLVPGKFPNYQAVIPETDSLTLNSAITFADPVGISSWLSSLPVPKNTSSVRLCPRLPHFVDIIHEQGHLTVTAYLQNNPPEIAFAPKLLATALAIIPGTLHLTDDTSPGVLRHSHALAVLMPMRITAPASTESNESAAA
jgi:DNA polymerase III sliding clamp (beta) subunit (PCNA family)